MMANPPAATIGGMPASATQSAAIQLAVWESIYEGANVLGLGSGLFSATSSAAVVGAANTMLAGASALATSVYHIKVL